MTRKTCAICYAIAGVCFAISGAAGFVAGRTGYGAIRMLLGAAMIFLAVINFRINKNEGTRQSGDAEEDPKE